MLTQQEAHQCNLEVLSSTELLRPLRLSEDECPLTPSLPMCAVMFLLNVYQGKVDPGFVPSLLPHMLNAVSLPGASLCCVSASVQASAARHTAKLCLCYAKETHMPVQRTCKSARSYWPSHGAGYSLLR